MTPDDAELLRQFVATRDEAAFAELVRRYLDLVYFAALRQVGGDAHRAEDVTQYVFTLLARKAPALARHQTLAGWLHTTTRFSALHAMRAERRRVAREREAHTMHESTSDPAANAEWERLRPVIDEALGTLSEQDREAVLLRYFAHQSFTEVGAKLNLSENTARMRVDRALDKLRGLLAKRGVTSTAAALGLVLANQAVASAPAGMATRMAGLALASADGATASVASFFEFMGTTKIAAGVVAGLLILGMAGYHIRAQHEADRLLAAVRANADSLAAKLRELDRRGAAAEQGAASLERSIAAARAESATHPEDATVTAGRDSVAEGKVFLQRHPEVAERLMENSDAVMNSTLRAFYKARGFAPDQIRDFQALLRKMGFGAGWGFAGGYTTATVDGKQLELHASEKVDMPTYREVLDRLRPVLGEEGLADFEKFGLISWAYQEARANTLSVAADLAFTDTPLTTSQAERLVQIMTDSFRRKRESPETINWDALDVAARDVLSEAQQSAWKSMSSVGRAKRAYAMAEKVPHP